MKLKALGWARDGYSVVVRGGGKLDGDGGGGGWGGGEAWVALTKSRACGLSHPLRRSSATRHSSIHRWQAVSFEA